MSDIITEKEKYVKGWVGGLPETPCGSGSTLAFASRFVDWMQAMIEKYDIKSISNVGAGDLLWWEHYMDVFITERNIEVHHLDLVPRHKDVVEFDVIQQVPPKADMLMLIFVLNHFPYEHCEKALENLKASGAKYLMMTDRPIWHHEQPPSIQMPYIEELVIRKEKNDRILLIEL